MNIYIFTILKNKTDDILHNTNANNKDSNNVPIDIEFYITADSTFGSAIDDISAMHVNSDLIMFFGSDLSSSGTIPTIIIPMNKKLNILKCSQQICSEINKSNLNSKDQDQDTSVIGYTNIILLSALPYYHTLDSIKELILVELDSDGVISKSKSKPNVVVGMLPREANISNWLSLRDNRDNINSENTVTNVGTDVEVNVSSVNSVSIGGFSIDTSIVDSKLSNDTNTTCNTGTVTDTAKNCYVYIGSENEQFHSVLLSVGDKHDVLVINTNDTDTTDSDTTDSDNSNTSDYTLNMYSSGCSQAALAIRKRYGGILRVKDASVIGLLIGSMGVSQEKIVNCICRMEKLIKTAHKKSYVFVMGRVTETKLCNFPEVDVYVLISNDDSCYVPPK